MAKNPGKKSTDKPKQPPRPPVVNDRDRAKTTKPAANVAREPKSGETKGDGAKKRPDPTPGFKVRARQPGYYQHKRRRNGDVFMLVDGNHFSKKWMTKVDAKTPTKITTGKQELRKIHDDVMGGRVRSAAAGGDEGGTVDESRLEDTGGDDVIGAGNDE